jgi:hypothetical protein
LLRVAFVESRDRIAEAIGGEDLRTQPASGRIDLEQRDLVELRRADRGQVRFAQPLHRYEVVIERQCVAERREDLLSEFEAFGLQCGSPRGEHLAPAVGGAGGVVDNLERLVEMLR